jgi:predicted nuclease of predicted toxin-antitoxin system
VNERFLIDECLSAGLVAVAKGRGFHADHVVHIGKAGWQDRNLAAFAAAHDYTIVTNNRRDFLREFIKLELHAGLIVILPRGNRTVQNELFAALLDFLALESYDLVNSLAEVLPDGAIRHRLWNAEHHDIGHIGNPQWSRSR